MTAAFLRSGLAHPRHLLLLVMVAAWGLRLAIDILVRSFLQIYLLQGAVILVVLAPVLLVMADPGGLWLEVGS